MDVQVNLWAVLAAAVSSMVVGGVWYSKLAFEETWMNLQKIDKKKMEQGAPKAMAGMFVLALIMGYVLASVAYISSIYFTDFTFEYAAFSTAFWVWVGFVLPVAASNSLFNQAPWRLTAIHAGNWLVTLLAMGVVIGLIGL